MRRPSLGTVSRATVASAALIALVSAASAATGDVVLIDPTHLDDGQLNFLLPLPGTNTVYLRGVVAACRPPLLDSDDIVVWDRDSGRCDRFSNRLGPVMPGLGDTVVATDGSSLDITVEQCVERGRLVYFRRDQRLSYCVAIRFDDPFPDCPDLSVGISGASEMCAGETEDLTAGSGFATYLWSPGGQTTRSISVSPYQTTDYQVTVTDDDACAAVSAVHTMTVHQLPTPVISGSPEVCAGESVTLDAGAGYSSYLWSPGGQTTQQITVGPSASTTYSVSVTDGNGCAGTSADHQVNVNQPPAPVISGPTEVCAGESVTLDAGAGYSSYLWSPGGQTTQQITVSPAATTSYSVAVSDETGCSGTSPEHLVTVTACNSLIFADDFETGDTSIWTETVGGS